MVLDQNELLLIARAAQMGSLAAAARTLGLAPSVATKRLAAVEERLGVRLFDRTTRSLKPTEHGQWLVEHAKPVLHQLNDLGERFREALSDASGRIRLASTFGFGRLWVGPAVARFQAAYPQITVEMVLTERLPDLAADGIDAAVWLWQVPQQREARWTSQMLAPNRRVLVASPSYIETHGAPRTPADVSAHRTLVVHEHTDIGAQAEHYWLLNPIAGSQARQRVPLRFALSSNSGELVRDWCLAGHGIALRSTWDAQPYLDRGELVHLLPQWAMTDADVHWVAPFQTRTPKRLSLLREHLVAELRSEPWKRLVAAPAAASPNKRPKR
jgi:LysR family transcriptional regulator, transcriptional activator for dmlA